MNRTLICLVVLNAAACDSCLDQLPPGMQPSTPPAEFDSYADMYNALGTTGAVRVVGRMVRESDPVNNQTATPSGEIAQSELEELSVELFLDNRLVGTFVTDDNGELDAVADLSALGLAPGAHSGQIRVDNVVAGTFDVTLLASDHAEAVVRSDVDLTYLDTAFQTQAELVALLGQDASERLALPGMAPVYQALARPTTFLSGSPKFFKRTLEGKMELDGVEQSGIILKPYKAIAISVDIFEIVAALKEQIGYKLAHLLELRAELPASTPEILMGDDSEADHIIYNLYHRFTAGELSLDELLEILDDHDVGGSWQDRIEVAGPAALASLKGRTPVVAIYINKTSVPNTKESCADWAVEGLSLCHDGSEPLMEDLKARGFVM